MVDKSLVDVCRRFLETFSSSSINSIIGSKQPIYLSFNLGGSVTDCELYLKKSHADIICNLKYSMNHAKTANQELSFVTAHYPKKNTQTATKSIVYDFKHSDIEIVKLIATANKNINLSILDEQGSIRQIDIDLMINHDQINLIVDIENYHNQNILKKLFKISKSSRYAVKIYYNGVKL